MPTILLFFLSFYFLLPLYRAFQTVRPPRFLFRLTAPEDHGFVYRDVTFGSSDRLKLSGWYIPSQNGAAVILVHGYGGNRLAMMVHAKTLARRGYGVLLYDMRAHGDSEGRLFASGWDTAADVSGAIAHLCGHGGIDPDRIGALGVSVGGQAVLRAAAQTDKIRAVVVDGAGPATLGDVWPPRSFLAWFYLPMSWMYEKALSWHTHVRTPAPLVEVIAQIAPRPVCLISTGRRSEQRFARRLYEAAGDPKTLWEIPEAHHAGGWSARPEEYAAKITNFFDAALLGPFTG